MDDHPPRSHESLLTRLRLDVQGRVQGVGFRPFVFRLARELRLAGSVGNSDQGVFIEVEGPAMALDAFASRLQAELPPLARIQSLTFHERPPLGEVAFRIVSSAVSSRPTMEITPDMTVCDDCLEELHDPRDRRHRYPFITCTNCGPRYSIIRSVPYDRENTTMASFGMCAPCRREYETPSDRRFHAQPNACPDCGPKVMLTDRHGKELEGEPFGTCARLLSEDRIVAVKGLGGFHLACRADSDEAVDRLRRLKGREARPFAMMVGSLAEARAIALVDAHAADVLCGPARPIVLVPKRPDVPISHRVAPNSRCFGIMLPYTPLHALLFAERPGPLVMTSGNPSAEPLCHQNEEAFTRLSGMVDAFLIHDRDIERPIDDSVVLVTPLPARKEKQGDEEPGSFFLVPLRRARGYVPEPIAATVPAPAPILAVGAELKSAVCLLSGRRAVLSEHLGELTNPAAYRNFIQAIERLEKLLQMEPEIVACDLHPDYAATRYARTLELPLVEVQHHHAHIVSCMVDNGRMGPVIGVSCDGTGYGTDGAVWGCEVLVCDAAGFTRFAHLDYFPLPGGDAAARDTWRPALALLHEAMGPEGLEPAMPLFADLDPEAVRLVKKRLESKASMPLTSSLGRLFDAVAFLLGLCRRNTYEAEAPMALEAAALDCDKAVATLPYAVEEGGPGAPARIDVRPLLRALLERLRRGEPPPLLAKAFHLGMASALADCAAHAAARAGIRTIALSGGCFANRLLLGALLHRLREADMDVLLHGQVPTGDGGIALGQAAVAASQTAGRMD